MLHTHTGVRIKIWISLQYSVPISFIDVGRHPLDKSFGPVTNGVFPLGSRMALYCKWANQNMKTRKREKKKNSETHLFQKICS